VALEDHRVYVKISTWRIMFLIVYIDDILLSGSNLKMIEATKRWLSYVLRIKDMGEVGMS